MNVSIGESISWQNCSVVNYRPDIVKEREKERVCVCAGEWGEYVIIFGAKRELFGWAERDRCEPLGAGSGGAKKKCGRR